MSSDAVYNIPGSEHSDPFGVGPSYDTFPPSKEVLQQSFLKSSSKQKRPSARKTFTDVTLTVVLPWLVFFLVMSLFLFAFHEVRVLTWAVVGLITGLAALFLVLGSVSGHVAFVAVGFLSFFSIAGAVGTGLWLNGAYLDRYYELDAGLEFKEVLPTADAKQTKGAAIIRFSAGSFVDDRRTLGFIADGGILCLAPVVTPGELSAQVQYWAVGEDCCEKRCNFDCGSSRDMGALSAVVERREPVHEKALAEAAAVYGLNVTSSAQLVNFVGNPKAAIGELWDETLTLSLIAMILDLCVCAMAGVLVAKILTIRSLLPS